MSKSKLNNQRRENYAFYRSVGYTPKQAANLRNKSPHAMISEYREAKSVYNEARFAKYRGETKTIESAKPYKPKIEVSDSDFGDYQSKFFIDYDVPDHITSQMTAENDFFKLEIYSERLEGLRDHFENAGMSWNELMEYLADIEDLGDWLDALGELYDEN